MSEAQIFQVLGLFFLAAGLGILINLNFYQKLLEDFIHSTSVIYLYGSLALFIGYLLVTFHNVQEGGWAILITVIGWIALIKGLLTLIFPNIQIKIAKGFIGKKGYIITEGVIFLIIGIVFSYIGYIS